MPDSKGTERLLAWGAELRASEDLVLQEVVRLFRCQPPLGDRFASASQSAAVRGEKRPLIRDRGAREDAHPLKHETGFGPIC